MDDKGQTWKDFRVGFLFVHSGWRQTKSYYLTKFHNKFYTVCFFSRHSDACEWYFEWLFQDDVCLIYSSSETATAGWNSTPSTRFPSFLLLFLRCLRPPLPRRRPRRPRRLFTTRTTFCSLSSSSSSSMDNLWSGSGAKSGTLPSPLLNPSAKPSRPARGAP